MLNRTSLSTQDRVTSGIIIVAKTEAAAKALTGAFRARRVTKYYIAVSDRCARRRPRRNERENLPQPRPRSFDPVPCRVPGDRRRRWEPCPETWPGPAAAAGSSCGRRSRRR